MPIAATVALTLVLAAACSSWVAAQGDGGRLRTGTVIYEEHCAGCHGLTGKGDGPDGRRLIVPPANLQSRRSRAKTDFELMTTIAYGVAYSPMHGWRGRLTDDEILEVMSHIRTMAPFDPIF